MLRTFESEPEARVVEAFLKANEVQVQLLGTHTTTTIVAPGSVRSAGLRLMVREDQMTHAKELLAEQESRAHLSVVPEGGPPAKSPLRYDRILIVAILVLVAILTYLEWAAP